VELFWRKSASTRSSPIAGQRLAGIPEAVFERHVVTVKASHQELTVKGRAK